MKLSTINYYPQFSGYVVYKGIKNKNQAEVIERAFANDFNSSCVVFPPYYGFKGFVSIKTEKLNNITARDVHNASKLKDVIKKLDIEENPTIETFRVPEEAHVWKKLTPIAKAG